jgi:sugar (pentulose or hexulose) kinase
VQKRVKPDPSAATAMKKQYENYRMLYPALKPLFARMA